MEKDDEVYGKVNSYTAEFWQYDSRLGRRWNIDPVVKYHESPYATFANNPIWFIDPSGADTSFTDSQGNHDQQAKKDFDKAYNTVKNKITELRNNITVIQNEINERQVVGKKTKKQEQKLEKTKEILKDWQKLETDFDKIISSSTLFVYTSQRGNINSKFDGMTGSDKDIWNSKEGRWDKVHIFVEGGRDDIVVHENRHANQKLQKVNWNQLVREMDAYTYQKIYNAKSVEEFRQKEYNKKYGHLDEVHRPPFHQFTLEKAIKSLYELGN